MAVFMSRDAELYVKLVDDTTTNVWLVPILAGFSFSQASESQEITLTEATRSGGESRRGKKQFNTALNAVEISFTSYIRPYKTDATNNTTHSMGHQGGTPLDGQVFGTDTILWALFAGATDFDESDATQITSGATAVVTANGTTCTTVFTQSNRPQLHTGTQFQFWLPNCGAGGAAEDVLYTIDEVVVNEVTIDFDVEGIAQVSWTCLGRTITEEGSGARPYTASTYDEGTKATDNNFIQNRLSTFKLTAANDQAVTGDNAAGEIFPGGFGGASNKIYSMVLTGGSLTFSNNISYLTPEEQGVVNLPIGHITGTRSVSGSATCYMSSEDGGSKQFFKDLTTTAALDVTTNKFAVEIGIGGTSATADNLIVNLPQATFEVPSHSFDDVISLETNFYGLPTDIEKADEANLVYHAK